MIGEFRRIPSGEPPKMRRRDTQDLASVLETLRVKFQIGRSSPEDAIREQWPELVGPANASYSHPIRIEYDRRLLVQASHAVVRNELFLHRATIVERIQKLPGCATVTELHIKAG